MSVTWQQKTHGVMRRRQNADRTLALVFLSVVVVVAFLAAAYLWVAASNVRLARDVWSMEQAVVASQRESELLRTEVARLSSIPILQERSVQLGYQPAEGVDYIYVGGP